MIMTTQRKALAVSGEIKPRITLTAKDYEGIRDSRERQRPGCRT